MKVLMNAGTETHYEGGWSDSPLTDHISIAPGAGYGSSLTFAAFGSAWPPAGNAVTWGDWVDLLGLVAHEYISVGARVFQSYALAVQERDLGSWQQVQQRGDYVLELSRVLRCDNTYGARLVNRQDGSVLQYTASSSSSGHTVWFSEVSALSSTLPVMTDVVLDEDAFAMTVEEDALNAMDAYERELEARYQASCERDARAMYFDRD
jgi:hypothetical protein